MPPKVENRCQTTKPTKRYRGHNSIVSEPSEKPNNRHHSLALSWTAPFSNLECLLNCQVVALNLVAQVEETGNDFDGIRHEDLQFARHVNHLLSPHKVIFGREQLESTCEKATEGLKADERAIGEGSSCGAHGRTSRGTSGDVSGIGHKITSDTE